MFVNAQHEKANSLLKEGNIQQALHIYLDLIAVFPSNADLLSDIGVAYLHLNDEFNCLEYLNRSLQQQPDYGYRYASRGFAYGHFKKFDEAIADYTKALELDPEDSVTHNNLGLILEQKGYHEEAQKRFEQADKLADAENRLHQMIDELEQTEKENPASTEVKTEKLDNKDSISRWKELKLIFTNREQRKQFFSFIKNGFKLK